jgi:hypothetical protein
MAACPTAGAILGVKMQLECSSFIHMVGVSFCNSSSLSILVLLPVSPGGREKHLQTSLQRGPGAVLFNGFGLEQMSGR